ncbi:MAG: tetratricopeptide repeat protein [Bacteroidetes bacterium]|nr:tetratricopeptide repeat protein [Bacteroidota bacterium]
MKNLILLLLLTLLLSSCDNTQRDLEALNAKREKLRKMKGEKDISAAKEIDKMFTSFYEKHPVDTNIPSFLFEHADLYLNELDNSEKAVDLLVRLYSNYPKHNKAPMALYLCAFTQENKLRKMDLAKAKYELLVKKYPNHQYSKDALKMLFWWDRGGTDAMVKRMMDSLQHSSSIK